MSSSAGLKPFNNAPETMVEMCAWPPGPGADQSGYSKFAVIAFDRPGIDGTSFDGEVDKVLFPAGCNSAAVDYTWAQMGMVWDIGWTHMHRGQYALINAEGRWPANPTDILGPAGMTYINSAGYVLHNWHAHPSDVRCVG